MPISHALRRRVLLIAALAAALPTTDVAADPESLEALRASGRVEPALVAALERSESARAIAIFRDPPGVAPLRRRLRRSEEARGRVRDALAARRERILAALPAESFRVERRFEATNAVVLTLDARGARALAAQPEVLRLGLDAPVAAQLAEALPLVELDDLRVERGLTGRDVQIAILDTGVDDTHPELSGAVIAEQCFCSPGNGCCPGPGTPDTQSGSGAAADDHGHGTRVAGIAASRGVTTPGAAPDVEIVAVKVLTSGGGGLESDVVMGLDWVLMNRPDVDVVNLSLAISNEAYAGDCDDAGVNPMLFATPLDALRAAGVLVVVATGNNGLANQMNPPACVASAVSVGAVWDGDVGSQSLFGCTDATTAADQVTCFSNSSSTTDLFAPGGVIDTPDLGGGTFPGRGTSYAAPVVAGCAAALLQRFDRATPDALEAALESSQVQVSHGAYAFPRLDCWAALEALRPVSVPGISPAAAALAAALVGGAGVAIAARLRSRAA